MITLEQSHDFIAYTRTLSCTVCGANSDAAHLIPVGMGNDRRKPSMRHFTVINLCREHHMWQEDHTDQEFFDEYGVDLWKLLASNLIGWMVSPDNPIEKPFYATKVRI